MIRLRLEALGLGAVARLGRRGPNRELEALAREISDLAKSDTPPRAGPAGQRAVRRAR